MIQVFKQWQTSPEVEFVNGTSVNSPVAHFKMPASNVTATATFNTLIESVNLSIVAPINGQSLNNNVTINDDNPAYSASAIAWQPSGGTVNGTSAYTATITLTPNSGYVFANPPSVSLNGSAPTSATRNQDGSVTITRTFAPTLSALSAPNITIAPAYGANRPTTVSGTNFAGTVSWSPSGATFPSGVSTGTFTLTANSGYRWNGGAVTVDGESVAGVLGANGTQITFTYDTPSLVGAGTFTDSRDNQTYGYKAMPDGKIWMTENLNYKGPSNNIGVNYNSAANPPFQGAGRLYTWAEVMAGLASSNAVPSGVQGIAPPGWHIPSDQEWANLVKAVDPSGDPTGMGNTGTAGTKLKARNSAAPSGGQWNSNGDGTDDFGFAALPAGNRYTDGSFNNVGNYGYWWTATESGSNAYYRAMYYNYAYVYRYTGAKGYGFSVRCVKD